MPLWRRILIGAGVAVLAGGAVYVVADMIHTSGLERAEGSGGTATATIKQHDFHFSPQKLLTPRGETLRLTVVNDGLTNHTFTSDALGVDVVVGPGQVRTVTVRPDRSGQFLFYCRFHQSVGMVGYVFIT